MFLRVVSQLYNNQSDTTTGWNMVKEDPEKLTSESLSQALEI